MISKEEKRARDNRRYAEHREEILARRRRRYAERREEEHRRRHEKYLRNKEKEAAARRRYAESHSEELREKRRQYYLEHKELIAEKHAQYYAAHREEYIASSRQWRLTHPTAHRLSVRRSHAKHSEERRARKAEQAAELKFFQGLAMVSAVTAPMDEHLSEECRLRLAERERHKKEWRLEWQRKNRDRMRLYKQRWLERLKADPERYQAYLDKEHARRRQSRTKHSNQGE